LRFPRGIVAKGMVANNTESASLFGVETEVFGDGIDVTISEINVGLDIDCVGSSY